MDPKIDILSKKELLFQEYMLITNETGRLSDRRQTVNNFYIGLNALLLTAMGATFVSGGLKTWWAIIIFFTLPFFVSIFNMLWYTTLNRFQRLANLRYKYLRGIEREMRAHTDAFPLIDISESQEFTREKNASHEKGPHESARGIFLLEHEQYSKRRVIFDFSNLEKRSIVALTMTYWLIIVLIAVVIIFNNYYGVLPPINF
jgi:hypothetical protein